MNLTFRLFAGWTLVAALGGACRAQSVFEYVPYKMQIYVSYDRVPELDDNLQQNLARLLPERIDARIGGAWRGRSEEGDENTAPPVRVVPAPPALDFELRRGSRALSIEQLPTDVFLFDKVLLLHVATRPQGGFALTATDFDVRTQQFSHPVTLSCTQREELASTAFQAVYEAFAPLAMIDLVLDEKQIEEELKQHAAAQGKPPRIPVLRVKLVVQASAITLRDTVLIEGRIAADPEMRPDEAERLRASALTLAPQDAVYLPVLRFNNRDLTPKSIRELPWTFLVRQPDPDPIEQTQGLDYVVFSGLSGPLSNRRRGRVETLALAVRPRMSPTKLTVVSRTDRELRLQGYEVFTYAPGNPTTTLLGYTDERGEIEIPPSQTPLALLIIKNGGEFLARFPVLPGWRERLTAEVRDDDARLSAEGFITALQEEMVEVYITRALHMERARQALAEGKAKTAREHWDAIKLLKTPDKFRDALTARQNETSSSGADEQSRRLISRLFEDTRAVLNKYLDLKPIEELDLQIRQAGG